MKKVSVLIADAQFLVRYGIRRILENESDVEIVGEVDDEEELLSFLATENPDLIILDYAQPGSFSPETLEKLLEQIRPEQLLVISSDENKQTIYRALEMGIQTFITKHCERDEVLNATRAAIKGDKFFCNQVIDYILEKSFAKEEPSENQIPLTPREIQIVQLIAKGFIAKEISALLNLSTHTIYTHRKNIMRKLELNTPSELILFAVKHNLVKSE